MKRKSHERNTVLATFLAFCSTQFMIVVDAHVRWIDPAPRSANGVVKGYPCGQDSGFGSGPITTLKPGKNTVYLNEFVCHGGDMMRIALSMGSDDDYNDYVLLDRIPHNDACNYVLDYNPMAVNITIPDVDCQECSLQLIQVMSSKFQGRSCSNPAGIQQSCGSDAFMYFSCARIRIEGKAKALPSKIFNDYYQAASPVNYKWPLRGEWCQDNRNNNNNVWRLCKDAPQAKISSSSTSSSTSTSGGTTTSPTFCFSGNTTVVTQKRGPIFMRELSIGDFVMVGWNKFEKVYSFGHYHDASTANNVEFIVINDKLEISPQHMIAVQDKGFVPASMVMVGDRIPSYRATAPIVVTSIRTTTSSAGAYAPFTASGTLLVNGFLVSSYVSLQPDSPVLKIGGVSTGLSHHWLAHTFLYPFRITCCYIGNDCPNEEYNPVTGLSTRIERYHNFVVWLLQQHPLVQLVLWIPIIILMMTLFVIDVSLSVLSMLANYRQKVQVITTMKKAQELAKNRHVGL